MNYLQKKKLAFMSIANQVKGFIRTIMGALPLTLEGCVDEESIIDYKVYGQSVQDGKPTPDNPVEVESVGEKTRNIWYPSVDALTSNGITCTRNNDNTYTVNGTATADFYFHIGKITIEVGTTYYLSGGTSQAPIAFQLREGRTGVTTLHNHGGITTFSPTGEHSIDIINCVIVVRSGVEVNNVIVKPMISLENTDEYEPYGYKIPIIASGKNLFDVNKWFPDYVNGDNSISYTNDDFRTIYAVKILKGQFKENTQYSISLDYELTKNVDTNFGVIIVFTGNDGSRIVNKRLPDKATQGTYSGQFFATNPIDTSISSIAIAYNKVTEDMLIKLSNIQIEEGETATTYEPYFEPVTTEIYLDEPLRGVKNKKYNYIDYIDYSTNLLHKKTAIHVLTGDENWVAASGYANTFQFYPGYILDAGLCTHYMSAPYASGYVGEKTCIYLAYTAVIKITDLRYSDVEELKSFLKEQYEAGNPVTCIYGIVNKAIDPINVDLPKIPIFNGTSIISADTTIQPSNAEIEYYSNVKE